MTLNARTVSMGNARSTFAKRGNDIYETPVVAVEPMLRAENGNLPRHLLDPCCATGRFANELRNHGYQVTAYDLEIDRIDFLMERKAPDGCEAIVTNPPYKLAAQFVRHGLELVPMVVMLLRLNFLESVSRSDLLDNGGLARVHVFANRLPRMHRSGWDGPKTSSTVAFAWFIWSRNYQGPIILDRIRWEI